MKLKLPVQIGMDHMSGPYDCFPQCMCFNSSRALQITLPDDMCNTGRDCTDAESAGCAAGDTCMEATFAVVNGAATCTESPKSSAPTSCTGPDVADGVCNASGVCETPGCTDAEVDSCAPEDTCMEATCSAAAGAVQCGTASPKSDGASCMAPDPTKVLCAWDAYARTSFLAQLRTTFPCKGLQALTSLMVGLGTTTSMARW